MISCIIQAIAFFCKLDALEEALSGHIDQILCFRRDLAAGESRRTVPVKSSDIRAYIAADDVTLFQHPRSRNAVDDLIVYADTDAGRIALIMKERGNRTLLADEMLHGPVDLLGCYAGLYQFPCISTGSRGNFSRSAHQFDLMCGSERNHWLISPGP